MITFICFKKVGLVYSRVGVGAGAHQKFCQEPHKKLCGSAHGIEIPEQKQYSAVYALYGVLLEASISRRNVFFFCDPEIEV
jgi:hypothetical protein